MKIFQHEHLDWIWIGAEPGVITCIPQMLMQEHLHLWGKGTWGGGVGGGERSKGPTNALTAVHEGRAELQLSHQAWQPGAQQLPEAVHGRCRVRLPAWQEVLLHAHAHVDACPWSGRLPRVL